MVDGIPVYELAQDARKQALAWSEPIPWNGRAARGSDRDANMLMGRDGMTYDYGDTTPGYVIALDGRFACRPPGCVPSGVAGGGATQDPTSSTTTTTAPVTTLVISVNASSLSVTGARLVFHQVDMARLGRVYNLDPYLAANARGVATGPSGPAQACPPFSQPTWWQGTFCGPAPGPGNGDGPGGECTGHETGPPCGPGAIPGKYYAYTLTGHCDGRTIFNGRLWDSELPPPTEVPPMHVWMALSADGHGAGFIAPAGAVGFTPDTGGAPQPCRGTQPPTPPPPVTPTNAPPVSPS